MLVSDARGNAVTVSDSTTVTLLDQAAEAYLGLRKDTGDRLKAALAVEPDSVTGHCLRGYFMMLFGQRAMIPRAQRSLEVAQAAARATGVTEREAAHVAALGAWVAGDFCGATSRWESIVADHPRDVLALKLAQHGRLYSGDSERMRDVLARACQAWDASVPGYGFVLGCYAFALEEAGDYSAAERVGREAVERNPADIWAGHAVAHVLEMMGRPREGVAWIERLQGNWAECNNFSYHAFWHRCLFLIELGALGQVLDSYDRDVRPESTNDLLDISNAVALLWRLEQAGVDVGNRWEELADQAQKHLDDHMLIFGDVHYLMALSAAGRLDEAARMVDSMTCYAAGSSDTEAAVAREPGLALALAVLAHRRRNHHAAVDKLLAIRNTIGRIGGSHAQRAVFEEMLIDSALRAGYADRAKILLAERLGRRPRNAWGWRHYAQALDQVGDGVGAARARELAEMLIAG